jgi:two-component system, LuxR family, sensor kinase FixL
MSEARAEQHRAGPMAFPRVFSLPGSVVGAAYVAGYVLLDWISFIDPFAPYGITPWNPPTGLSFVLVLLFGQRLIPLLFVAPFLADLTVRQLPFSWTLELAVTAIIGAGYSLALLFLLRPKTRFNPALSSLRDVFLLLATAAVSSALVAASYVGAVFAAGILPARDFGVACLRFWVGDVIGIAVIAPFLLIFLTRGQLLKLSMETALQFIAIFVALWLVFGFAPRHHLQFFYVLFLPIVWMAVRSGLEGVAIGILLTQLGLIVGVHMLPPADVDVTTFQALMLVLAMTGLMAGTLVTENRRTEFQLRLHQDSLARLGRLGSMGEFAAAVAHEINQPLMAAGTYSRLVLDTLHGDRHSDPAVVETAGKVAAQVERASEVVKRLRALVRLDRDGRAPTSIERIVTEALDLCQPDLDRNGIRVRANIANNLPLVIVDLLQIEQVLLNIFRNAIEAMNETAHGGRTITIDANLIKNGDVEVSVRDTGPGFPAELLADQFPPFSTTKPEGLGVGLSLSRTIVEAHGGRLTTGGDSHGAVVRFTLPSAMASHG